LMPLAFARPGSLVRVVAIRGGRGVYAKLRDLGIYEGKVLRVVSSMGGGPVIVEVVNGSPASSPRVALGFGISMKVLVEEVAPVGRA